MNKLSYGIAVFIMSGAILLSSCSMNLGPETLPSIKPTTTTTETETSLTTATIKPEATDPFSTAVVTEGIVEKNGFLTVKDSGLVNVRGQEVVLKGMSSFGIQDCGDFFTFDAIKTLAQDWGCDVIRICINGDANTGYMKEPDKYFDPICKICDLCIKQGIYVIVDWNVGYEKDASENKKAAVDFFTRLSVIYAEDPNVIYEINNDPIAVDEEHPIKDEWAKNIAPFASEVITAIRKNSPKSLVIVGAPNFGLDVDVAAKAKLKFDNVIYGCRFFSGAASDEQREKIKEARGKGICVFVTEWGLCSPDCKGGLYYLESDKWIAFFDENKISWCNYAIGSYITNDANALSLLNSQYRDEQKASHWPDGLISKSGMYIREKLLVGKAPEGTTESSESSSSDSSASSETTKTT